MKRVHRLVESARQPFRIRSHRAAPGLAPGTLRPPPDAPAPRISMTTWSPGKVNELEDASVTDVVAALESSRRVWVNLTGLGDADIVRDLGGAFGLHPLLIEDLMNVHQRPKVETVDGGIFTVLRMAPSEGMVPLEQVAFVLRKNAVLTVQERPGDAFDPVRERLRRADSRVRAQGADFLFYALVDALVDGFYAPLEWAGEELDRLEEDALDRPHEHQLLSIRSMKRLLLHYRRALWPMREAVAMLDRVECPDLRPETRLHLRDCHDHVLQLIDLVETFREVASGLLDVYLSSVSNRMNEVMRVLTVISTIFIPLTFVAGVYGMNFDPDTSPWNMPELRWAWGYPASLLLMCAIAGGMVVYFRRKGWFGGGRDAPTQGATRERSDA